MSHTEHHGKARKRGKQHLAEGRENARLRVAMRSTDDVLPTHEPMSLRRTR